MTTRVFFAVVPHRLERVGVWQCGARRRRQGGDQFLDGIGETGLIARYVLNGNAEDSSRNQFHAALRGTGGTFVEDAPFRRVLLLTGDGSHLQLPGADAGRRRHDQRHGLAVPADRRVRSVLRLRAERVDHGCSAIASPTGFRASIVVGRQVRGETAAKPLLENQWLHFAVVLDPASRVLTAYLDGAKGRPGGGRRRDGHADRAARRPARRTVCSSAARRTTRRRRFTRGCATSGSTASRSPISRWPRFAPTGCPAGRRREAAARRRRTSRRPHPERLAARVTAVARARHHGRNDRRDAAAAAGTTFRRVYRDQRAAGPDVRVIWPSPTDNSEVAKPGSYTVTGKVPGTPFEPKATVIVKVPVGTTTPPSRLAEAVSAQPGRARARHRGPRHAVHQEPRQVHPRSGGQQSRQLSLQLQGRVRPAAARRRAAARRLGQPDDEAARPCERPLPDGDRAGLREHDLRRGAARELPRGR